MEELFHTRFCDLFSIRLPLVQAGMAGNITSPQMVAAVSEAGGLGTLGGAYMKPDALRQAIRQVKELTKKPFSVNLLISDEPPQAAVSPELTDWINQMRAEVGLDAWSGEVPDYVNDLDECFSVILDEKVPVFSVAFQLPGRYGQAAKQAGMKLIGMATTVAEALALQAEGVDAVVAQGGEAGGHRGTFSVGPSGNGETVGMMALLPLMADALPDTPVIAAGGIMDGRGVVAALALGADAVQLGTRFLACEESLAHRAYKEKLAQAKETEPQITRAFSGRPARGLSNRLMETFARQQLTSLPYPLQNSLTREIRNAAAKNNQAEYMSLWAGQGVPQLAKKGSETAGEIVESLFAEARQVLNRIGRLG